MPIQVQSSCSQAAVTGQVRVIGQVFVVGQIAVVGDSVEMNPHGWRSNGKVVPAVATPGDFFDGTEMNPGIKESQGRCFP